MIKKENYETLKNEFGNISSWAIWKKPRSTPKSNMRDVSMFDNSEILNEINPSVILVGLNASGVHDGYMDETRPWRFFHSSNPRGNDFKLRYALMDTPFWGGYITDLIKNHPEVDSNKVKSFLKSHPEVVEENITVLRYEMSLLDDNPLVIALGDCTYDLLVKYLSKEYRIAKIKHYSYTIGKENYRKEALKELSKFNSDYMRTRVQKCETETDDTIQHPHHINQQEKSFQHSTTSVIADYWNADIENILFRINSLTSEIFKGSDYYSKRNPTIGEKCINIYRSGNENRIGHIWPKIRKQCFHVNLAVELINQISGKVSLPADFDVKPQIHDTWRQFIVDENKMLEIINAIASKKSRYSEITAFISKLSVDTYGNWVNDNENDGTAEHPKHFSFVSYTEVVSAFINTIISFYGTHQEFAGPNFLRILEKNDVDMSKANFMDKIDFNNADAELVVAIIIGIIQAERFSTGVLLEYLNNGFILRCLNRLVEIDI